MSSAQAAQLSFSGAFGTPFACLVFNAGGADAVWNYDSTEETMIRGPIPDDDAFYVIEPTGLTSLEWNCDVTHSEGDRVDFACVDGTTFQARIAVSGDLMTYENDETKAVLARCR
jgi:hypothetical protein